MRFILLTLTSITTLFAYELRHNQLGYRAQDTKLAYLCSFTPTTTTSYAGTPFVVLDAQNDTALKGIVSTTTQNNGFTAFKQIRTIDLSALSTEGLYTLKVGTVSSSPFTVGTKERYEEALEAGFDFFASQRCGVDAPLHAACHLKDSLGPVDGRGGWHDAGDYIKYMITIGFTTLELLSTADYGLHYFPSGLIDTRGTTGIPDALEESKVGTDWILAMTSRIAENKLYYQVAGEEDHWIWRLPEEDDTNGQFEPYRSFFEGWGYNLSGKTVAALAAASRLWQTYDSTYAKTCLARAEALWAKRELWPTNQASNPADFYSEGLVDDDLLLGATELYLATQKAAYRTEAQEYLSSTPGYSIEWGKYDFLSVAQTYRAGIDTADCRSKMESALTNMQTHADDHSFNNSGALAWGTNAVYTGNAQAMILYMLLTKDSTYQTMAQQQIDYLFGANNWGVSFMIGLGETSPVDAHSQLNDLAGLNRGGVVGGPALSTDWQTHFTAPSASEDPYSAYQGMEVYYDLKSDYYTNEVAIDYTAATMFLLHYNRATSTYSSGTTALSQKITQATQILPPRIGLQGHTLVIDGVAEEGAVILHTLQGRILKRFTLSQGSNTLLLPENHAPGLYILTTRIGKNQWRQKIVL